MKWTVFGLVYTGAFAVVAWTISSYPYFVGVAMIFAGALLWIGARVYNQFHIATRIRLLRSQEIEASLGMNHHRLIDAHSAPDYEGELKYRGGLARWIVIATNVLAFGLLAAGVFAVALAPLIAVLRSAAWR